MNKTAAEKLIAFIDKSPSVYHVVHNALDFLQENGFVYLKRDEPFDLQSGKENTLKVLAGIYNFNTGEWLLSNDITAHPDNDTPQLKAFIESCVAKDTSSFFEAPKEIVTDDNYKAKQHLLEIFSFLQGKENELGFELSLKERLIASTQLLKLIAKVQLINTQQNEVSYGSKTFEDAKKIIFNSLSASALTKEDLTAIECPVTGCENSTFNAPKYILSYLYPSLE